MTEIEHREYICPSNEIGDKGENKPWSDYKEMKKLFMIHCGSDLQALISAGCSMLYWTGRKHQIVKSESQKLDIFLEYPALLISTNIHIIKCIGKAQGIEICDVVS